MRGQRSTPFPKRRSLIGSALSGDVFFYESVFCSTCTRRATAKPCTKGAGLGSLPRRSRMCSERALARARGFFTNPRSPFRDPTVALGAALQDRAAARGRNGQDFLPIGCLVPAACERSRTGAPPEERQERQVGEQCHAGRAEVDDEELHKSPAAKQLPIRLAGAAAGPQPSCGRSCHWLAENRRLLIRRDCR